MMMVIRVRGMAVVAEVLMVVVVVGMVLMEAFMVVEMVGMVLMEVLGMVKMVLMVVVAMEVAITQ